MSQKSKINHKANVSTILELAGMELEAQEDLDICHEIEEQRAGNEKAYEESHALVECSPRLLSLSKLLEKVLSGNLKRERKFLKEIRMLRHIIRKCESKTN